MDVTDISFLGSDCILFFDINDFLVFLGLLSDEEFVAWSFI